MFFVGCGKTQTGANNEALGLPLDPDKIPFGADTQKVRQAYGLKDIYMVIDTFCLNWEWDNRGPGYPSTCTDVRLDTTFTTTEIGDKKVSFRFNKNGKLSNVDVNIERGVVWGEHRKMMATNYENLQKNIALICNNRLVERVNSCDGEGGSGCDLYEVWNYNKNLDIILSASSTSFAGGTVSVEEEDDEYCDKKWELNGGLGECGSYSEVDSIYVTLSYNTGTKNRNTGYDSIGWGANVENVKRVLRTEKRERGKCDGVEELKDVADSISASVGVYVLMHKYFECIYQEGPTCETCAGEYVYRRFYFYKGKLYATKFNDDAVFCNTDVVNRLDVAPCNNYKPILNGVFRY